MLARSTTPIVLVLAVCGLVWRGGDSWTGVPAAGGAVAAAELKEHTLAAFQRYTARTEERFLSQARAEGSFLYIDYLPERLRRDVFGRLRRGELYMERLETRAEDGGEIDVDDGLIHHWLGVVFIPGATLEQTIGLVQDYERHGEVYAPDVQQASIEERDGDEFRIFMRFRKKKVITVIVDTWHDVRYVRPASDRVYSLSRTTSVREVENAGEADERRLADGEGNGFLWRLNSYWRFQRRDGGVFVECESVSLTRTIPFLLRWLVSPFVNDVPRESLEFLLERTRSTLTEARTLQRRAPAPHA